MAKGTTDEPIVQSNQVLVPLNSFAQQNALKYGVELMGGFYHTQEREFHFADTAENWHKLIDEYSKQEVK